MFASRLRDSTPELFANASILASSSMYSRTSTIDLHETNAYASNTGRPLASLKPHPKSWATNPRRAEE